MRGDTHKTIACRFDQLLAGGICFPLVFVNGAVNFHDQPFRRAEEIHHERADGLLAAKLAPVKLAVAQRLPEDRLAGGGFLAEQTRHRDHFLFQHRINRQSLLSPRVAKACALPLSTGWRGGRGVRHIRRVQMPDALPGLLAHPLAVVAHVRGQPGCPLPQPMTPLSSQWRGAGGEGPVSGVHGRLARELRRDFDQGLVDHHGHRVQVAGVGLQPQALGLQRDRPTPGEGVQQRRRVAPGAQPDQLARGLQDALVGRAFPQD